MTKRIKFIFSPFLFFSFLTFLLFTNTSQAQADCNPGYSCRIGNVSACEAPYDPGACNWLWGQRIIEGTCINAYDEIDPLRPDCGTAESCCAPTNSDPACSCGNTCSPACDGKGGWTVSDCPSGQSCTGTGQFCDVDLPANYCQTSYNFTCQQIGGGLSACNQVSSCDPQTDSNCYSDIISCAVNCPPITSTPTFTPTPTPVQSSCTPGQCTLAGTGTGCIKCYDAGGGNGQWSSTPDWTCPNYTWQQCLCDSNPSDPSCSGPAPTNPPGCNTNPSCSNITARVTNANGNPTGPSVSLVNSNSANPSVLNISSGDIVQINASNADGDNGVCPYHTWTFSKDGGIIATEVKNTQANAGTGLYCYDNPGAPAGNSGNLYYPGYKDIFAYSGGSQLSDLRIYASPGQWGSTTGCLGGNATACNSDTWGRNDCSTWEPGAQCAPAGHGGVSGLGGASGIGLPCTGKQGQTDSTQWSFQSSPQSFPRKYGGDGIINYKFDNFSGTSDITVAATNNGAVCKVRVSGSQSVGGQVTDSSTGLPITGVKVLIYDIFNGVDMSVIDTTDTNGNFLTNAIPTGHTYSVWPQCVSGYNGVAGSMLSSYAAPIGYLCNSSYGPLAKYSPHAYFAGSPPTFPNVGDYYDLAAPFGMPSGGSTKFDFQYIPISKYPLDGTVFPDLDHNGTQDGSMTDCAGATVTLSGDGTGTQTPNPSTGAFSFGDINAGNYTVTLTNIPASCQVSTANPVNIVLNNPTTVNFGVTPLYTISGNVFVDNDKNTLKNGGETNYTGGSSTFVPYNIDSATVPTPTPVPNATGAYTFQNLVSGNYKISYTTLPTSYNMTYPKNGPPPFLNVRVGKPGSATYPCSAGTSNSATCDAVGNISNANYGITNSTPWIQCDGGDCSNNDGFVSNIPVNSPSACSGGSYASVTNGTSSTTPGMIYSGTTDPDFGSGQSSVNPPYGWVVGDLLYPELFQPVNSTVIRSSYGYMNSTAVQSGLTPAVLDSACNNSLGCSLTSLGHGLYSGSGVVYINASALSCKNADGTNGNCVFLINGDLHIQGNVTVPADATATFSVLGDIYVDKSVTGIAGFYSADGAFYTGGNDGDCTQPVDSALTIGGSVIVNAGLAGGSFQNQRDLCAGNLTCPAVTFKERPDLILNAPEFLKHPTYIWHEAAP